MPETSSASPSKSQIFFVRLCSTVGLWLLIMVSFRAEADWPLVLLISAAGFLTLVEYLRMAGLANLTREFIVLGVLTGAAYWVGMAWTSIATGHEAPFWLDLVALAVALQGAFLLTLRHHLAGHATLMRVFDTVFSIAYAGIMFGFLLRLLMFNHSSAHEGRYLALLVTMTTKFGDMGAYVVGSIFGRRKMIPHISPAKTWEGFCGAILFCFLAVTVMMLWVPGKLAPLTWTTALILAPILALVGIVGDLAESVLKRCHGIKDSGHKLPGIGGILDLTDSLLFTSPVAYAYFVLLCSFHD